MWTFFLFAVLLFIKHCRGYHNVTVDDSSPSITYTGTWNPLSEESNGLDFGGAHHVSLKQGSLATFSFTGVAFYYIAPLWPYPVTTVVSVDGESIVVDLQDHNSPQQPCCGAENQPAKILASFKGLSNGIHSVVCSMEPNGQFVVVDGFIYTVADPGDDAQTDSPSASTVVVAATVTGAGLSSSSASSSAASTTTGSSPSSPSSSSSPSSPSSSSSPSQPANTTLYIAIGAGIGGVGLIAAVMLVRRRRRPYRPAGPEESVPFMAASASTRSSSTTTTSGFLANAVGTNANHGHFSEVQGGQSNTHIHTINNYITKTPQDDSFR